MRVKLIRRIKFTGAEMAIVEKSLSGHLHGDDRRDADKLHKAMREETAKAAKLLWSASEDTGFPNPIDDVLTERDNTPDKFSSQKRK